jgi:hypothetical protein
VSLPLSGRLVRTPRPFSLSVPCTPLTEYPTLRVLLVGHTLTTSPAAVLRSELIQHHFRIASPDSARPAVFEDQTAWTVRDCPSASTTVFEILSFESHRPLHVNTVETTPNITSSKVKDDNVACQSAAYYSSYRPCWPTSRTRYGANERLADDQVFIMWN